MFQEHAFCSGSQTHSLGLVCFAFTQGHLYLSPQPLDPDRVNLGWRRKALDAAERPSQGQAREVAGAREKTHRTSEV